MIVCLFVCAHAHGEADRGEGSQCRSETRCPRGTHHPEAALLLSADPQPPDFPATCGTHGGKGPPAGTDRDDGWTAVLQVQEQGHHALVHLGSQATWFPACHRCYQVPKQCHGRCPYPVALLQDRGLRTAAKPSWGSPPPPNLGTCAPLWGWGSGPQQDPFTQAQGSQGSVVPPPSDRAPRLRPRPSSRT